MSLRTITKGIFVGVLTGGILGSLAGLLGRTNTINNFEFKAGTTVNFFIIGATIGTFIGGGIGHLMRLSSPSSAKKPVNNPTEQVLNDTNQKASLLLHQEQIDITKEKIQTGEVKVHKEVFQEQKTITVPVTHEELVIEKKLLNPQNSDQQNQEVIRIPLTEEEIEILKRPVILNDVDIYKNEYQETKTIEETLKKEKLKVESKGDTIVINKEVD